MDEAGDGLKEIWMAPQARSENAAQVSAAGTYRHPQRREPPSEPPVGRPIVLPYPNSVHPTSSIVHHIDNTGFLQTPDAAPRANRRHVHGGPTVVPITGAGTLGVARMQPAGLDLPLRGSFWLLRGMPIERRTIHASTMAEFFRVASRHVRIPVELWQRVARQRPIGPFRKEAVHFLQMPS